MQEIFIQPEQRAATERRASALFTEHARDINLRADRLFVGLLVFQWVVCILAVCWTSPRTWDGAASRVHPHVWHALLFGGVTIAYPIVLAFARPGSACTRQAIAVAQMLFSSLIIHLSGGRIETHFHIFGSLAFLAFYRDWRVLITASAVTAADHLLHGLFEPQSFYGVQAMNFWRGLEHAGWVIFEDIFLIISIRQSKSEMQHIATRQAQLEAANETIEAVVVARTSELKASERMTRLIVDTALDGVITIDEAGRITGWNPQAEIMFGWTREEALGLSLAETIIPEAYHEAHRQGMEVFLATGAGPIMNKRIEIIARHRDGREFPAELAISPLALGDTFTFSAFVRDITERKLLETQLSHAQKMESIGQLAAGIAHEINTPIQYIGDNARFLEEGFAALSDLQARLRGFLAEMEGNISTEEGSSSEMAARVQAALEETEAEYMLEEMPKALHAALDGVERVAHIVKAMKHFSHPGTAEKTPINLNVSIESTITVARNEWKYAADVVTTFDADLPLVPCLPSEFNQVILNLIVNAAHAIGDVVGDSGQKGLIAISTRRAGEWVEIRVQDSGTGISDAIRSRIFDPFFTTKEVGKGTGQGLAIAHSIIVEKHSGRIEVETAPDEGTTFVLWLPLEAEAKEEGGEAEQPKSAPTEAARRELNPVQAQQTIVRQQEGGQIAYEEAA